MHHTTLRRALPTTMLAVAMGLAGCTADEPTGPDAATSEATTTPDAPTATGADDGVASMTFTDCEAEQYTLPHPQEWHTNDPGIAGACQVFHPDEFDLPDQPQDRDLHWAVSVHVDSVEWDQVTVDGDHDEVVAQRETTVDGNRALVVEHRGSGQALLPEGELRYGYRVDLDGEVLFAVTHSVGETDYERDKAVLDRMMKELRLHDANRSGDDPEAVVSHDTGERQFDVYAYSIADGVCLEVRAEGSTGEDCGPVEGAIDVRVITVADQEYVTGIVGGSGGAPITEIAMVANDGSEISDELATAELVQVLGESGFRAFAPAEGPAMYRAVAGYGPDGDEVARVEL